VSKLILPDMLRTMRGLTTLLALALTLTGAHLSAPEIDDEIKRTLKKKGPS
jgi:hypothetical protein